MDAAAGAGGGGHALGGGGGGGRSGGGAGGTEWGGASAGAVQEELARAWEYAYQLENLVVWIAEVVQVHVREYCQRFS